MMTRPQNTSDTGSTRAKGKKDQDELAELKTRLALAEENEKRALADYQNLVRRQREDRTRIITAASQEVIETILEPLEHLSLASQKIDDPGLTMIIDQLWQRLGQLGLRRLEVMGEEFNERTMEAVERRGNGSRVIEVVKPGFSLGDHVITHARVIVGDENAEDDRADDDEENKQKDSTKKPRTK